MTTTDLRAIMAECQRRVPAPNRPEVAAVFARWSEAALATGRTDLAALLTGLGQQLAGYGPPPTFELVNALELRVVALRVEELCGTVVAGGGFHRSLETWCNMVAAVIALERQRRVKEGERLDWLLMTGDEPPEVQVIWTGEGS